MKNHSLDKPTLLVAESKGFSVDAVARLQPWFRLELADLDKEGLKRRVHGADVLWVRLRHWINGDLMAAAPGLRAVVTSTTGLNHIDLKEARRRDIDVLSLQDAGAFLKNVRATAEHTIALALALLRRVPAATRHAASGEWDRDLFWGHELHGRVAGVVGYGRLGRIVSEYFRAFGMHVLAADPAGSPDSVAPGVELVTLPQLLGRADLVSLHASFSPGSGFVLGRAEFEKMRTGSWLVNTSRGELVDEVALLEVLESGRLAGAAVDVLSFEHEGALSGNRLMHYARGHDNLLITPHIGGCTFESIGKTEAFMAQRLVRWLEESKRGAIDAGFPRARLEASDDPVFSVRPGRKSSRSNANDAGSAEVFNRLTE